MTACFILTNGSDGSSCSAAHVSSLAIDLLEPADCLLPAAISATPLDGQLSLHQTSITPNLGQPPTKHSVWIATEN